MADKAIGDTFILDMVVRDANGADLDPSTDDIPEDPIWASSDEAVLTLTVDVNSATANVVGAGAAVVTCTYGSLPQATYDVNVAQPMPMAASIEIVERAVTGPTPAARRR